MSSVRSITRRFGVIPALHFVTYRVLQRLLVLDVEHLMLLDAPIDNFVSTGGADLSIHDLNHDQVRQFSENPEHDLDEAMLERVELENNYCLAALEGAELVGYAWFALGSIPPEHNRGSHPASGVGLRYPTDMAYMYKGFVVPKHRGKSVYGRIIAGSLRYLDTVGVQRLLCNVDWTNFGAINSCKRVGYKSLGFVWRFGYPQKMFTIPPRSARRLGISVMN